MTAIAVLRQTGLRGRNHNAVNGSCAAVRSTTIPAICAQPRDFKYDHNVRFYTNGFRVVRDN